MSMRTSLGRVRGLGSAKEGTRHWWHQRLTAIALIPLSLWFAISLIWMVGDPYEEVTAWLAAPIPGTLMILMVGAGIYHLKLGMQVVIEDYVHTEWLKISGLVIVTFWSIVLGLGCIIAVLSLMFGA